MQIYADVINKPMRVAAIDETVALGAALMGAYAAYKKEGVTVTYNELQDKSCLIKERVFTPDAAAAKVYREIYEKYKLLHDSFGVEGTKVQLSEIMKDLMEIKNRVS